MELTLKQKRKIEKLADVVDKGNIGVFEYLSEIEDKFEEKTEELEQKFEEAVEEIKETAPDLKKVLESIKGKDGADSTVPGPKGEQGEPGYTPVKGVDYFDGKDGKDGKNGKDGKDAPIPDTTTVAVEAAKIAEQRLEPFIPKIEDIAKDLPKLGERIRDGLELLQNEERLDKSAIKGLEEEFKSLERQIASIPRGGGASRRVFIPYRDDLSSSCDGSNKTFYLSRAPLDEGTIMVYGTDFPVILRPSIDFTIANKALTLSSAVPAPNTGATLLVTYFA